MTEAQAIRYITEAFKAKLVPLGDILPKPDFYAELYAEMDNDGVFDEPWWLGYEQ